MLIYKRESILVIDYKKYKGSIIKRLLKITEKISQLREAEYENHKLNWTENLKE